MSLIPVDSLVEVAIEEEDVFQSRYVAIRVLPENLV
jgi:hypothetical protein